MGTTPQMALVKVVSDELTALMGAKGAKDLEQGFPQIVLMAGLQVWGREAEKGEGKDSSGWFVGQRCCCEELMVVSILPHPPLQGVGKTTACGKLALYLRKQKKSVLMVATDVYRPAAIDQLVKLGKVRSGGGGRG